MSRGKAPVFIQIHRAHIPEAELPCLFPNDKLPVQGNGSRTRSQPQHAGGLLLQKCLVYIRRKAGRLLFILGYDPFDSLMHETLLFPFGAKAAYSDGVGVLSGSSSRITSRRFLSLPGWLIRSPI